MGSLIGNLWRRGHLTILAMYSPLSPGVEVSLSSIEDIKCPPQTDDTPAYFPDEDDCHVFYVCVWSKPQRMTCPGELHFDPILNVCNWRRTSAVSSWTALRKVMKVRLQRKEVPRRRRARRPSGTSFLYSRRNKQNSKEYEIYKYN